MADAGARRHDAEVGEGALPPFQELVALAVALVFALDIELEGARVAEFVHHDRVVDDEIDGVQRVDLLRVAAERDHGVAHRGEVHHRRDAGEVLHQHAGRAVGDLAGVAAALRGPFREGADVVEGDRPAVLETQHVLQHDLKRGWQAAEIAQARGLGGGDGVVGVARPADLQLAARPGGVGSNENGHRGLRAMAGWDGKLSFDMPQSPRPRKGGRPFRIPSYTQSPSRLQVVVERVNQRIPA